jgi:predicted lysophospholipase L1 biosynthesis ABC-type transport system permease subunit
MAERLFPNSSPLGRRFGSGGPENSDQVEIIGVVKDARYGSLTEELRPMAYYPHSQGSAPLENFVVRFSGTPEIVVPQVRQAIKQVNRNLPVNEVVSLSEHIGRSLVQQKLVARLASFFGLLALLLACVGLYGVLSYAVARRTNEIGVRMALGAQPRGIVVLVMREVLLLVALGAGIGLAATMLTTRLVSTLLFGLTPTDPLTVATATLLLVGVTALAGYLPARRASRVNPLVALRNE